MAIRIRLGSPYPLELLQSETTDLPLSTRQGISYESKRLSKQTKHVNAVSINNVT